MSAVRSSDGALHEELSNSTKLSTVAINTYKPVSKDCVVQMKEMEIIQIVQLTESGLVNILDLSFLYHNGTTNDQPFANMTQVSLVNPIGREILYMLDIKQYSYFPWTLNAGRKNIKLHINESHKECIERKNSDHVAGNILKQIVFSMKQPANYEICYLERKNISEKVRRICCQITKPNFKKLNYKCLERNSFLHKTGFPRIVTIVMFVVFPLYFIWLLSFLLKYTVFNLEYSEYCKLEETTISPSSIALKIIWDDKGRLISFIRKSILTCFFFYCYYLICKPIKTFNFVGFLVLYGGISLSAFHLCRRKITDPFILLRKIKMRSFGRKEYNKVARLAGYKLRQEYDIGGFDDLIHSLTLLLDIERWRKSLEKCHNGCFHPCVDIQFGNNALKCLLLSICYLHSMLYCLLYICFVFLYAVLIICLYIIGVTRDLAYFFRELEYYVETPYGPWTNPLYRIHYILFNMGFWLLIGYTLYFLVYASQSFLLGLLLNLSNFIPYLASFSVFTFYCCNYWKFLEEEYISLKWIIYEACQEIKAKEDKEGNNNSCTRNKSEKVLPLVSKELYDKIRDTYLPYNTNIFYYSLKILWCFIFSYGIFELVNMLNALNIPAAAQIVTTMSLSIIPHVFNTIALRQSEAKKKARDEKLKLNVKRTVEELTVGNPELAWTVKKRTFMLTTRIKHNLSSLISELISCQKNYNKNFSRVTFSQRPRSHHLHCIRCTAHASFLNFGSLQLFFDLYHALPSTLSPLALGCLIQIASVRRSLFSNAERSKFLDKIVSGIKGILDSPQSLAERSNYHEFCRLMSRLKSNYQLAELVKVEGYPALIATIAKFTVTSLQMWQFSPNSIHYLLGLWQRMVCSTPYIKSTEPHLLETYTPEITKAYITSRIDSVQVVIRDNIEDPLDDLGTVAQQLEQISTIGRFEYPKTCTLLISTFDQNAQSFEEAIQPGSSSSSNIPLYEGRLTWLVYIIGAVIGGRGSTYTTFEEYDALDGELVCRVLQLMTLTDSKLSQRGCEKMELSYLSFFDQFRKIYVGDQAQKTSKAYRIVSERLGLHDESMVLSVFVTKIVTNIKYWMRSDAIIPKTLQLLSDLSGSNIRHSRTTFKWETILTRIPSLVMEHIKFSASNGDPVYEIICKRMSSVRKLQKLEAVQFILRNHTAEHFPFLGANTGGQYTDMRCRTTFYVALGRLLIVDLGENEEKFEQFMIPLSGTFRTITSRLIKGDPNAFQIDETKRILVGICRDLTGLTLALTSKASYMMLFDWIYPQFTPVLVRALELWYHDPNVTTPVLKLMTELMQNRSQRLHFGVSSPNGILLFRECSKVLVAYGSPILTISDVPADRAYTLKYPF
ncbi:exportin-7 [Paramuricea clavata]|uniref:Exportin-7 n=1 Tax=Paramuricea clavata TaxID=317549 RepID=A0A6S7J0H3_PARCT|nr:exportin-7 [Paramuricea clavata]